MLKSLVWPDSELYPSLQLKRQTLHTTRPSELLIYVPCGSILPIRFHMFPYTEIPHGFIWPYLLSYSPIRFYSVPYGPHMAPCDPIRSHIKVSCSFICPHTVSCSSIRSPYSSIRSDAVLSAFILSHKVPYGLIKSFYCPMWSLYVPYGPIRFHL